jgi:hypothetical protein
MVLFQGILDARRNRFCLAEAGTVTMGSCGPPIHLLALPCPALASPICLGPLNVCSAHNLIFVFHSFCPLRVDTLARPKPHQALLPPSFLSRTKSLPKLDLSAIESNSRILCFSSLLSSSVLSSPTHKQQQQHPFWTPTVLWCSFHSSIYGVRSLSADRLPVLS